MIRKANNTDLSRIAEIFVFNNRINFLPIFNDPSYSFKTLQVTSIIDDYFSKQSVLDNIYVFEDNIVMGFIQVKDNEICKLYVDTFFQNDGIGSQLINFAINKFNVNTLWALEKNKKAISFYKKVGFKLTNEKRFEEDTTEYLVRMIR